MVTPDLLIKRLEDEKISREEKLSILDEFKKELKRYESGDLTYFRDTAIYTCFKYFYDSYLQKLSNQSTQSNPC